MEERSIEVINSERSSPLTIRDWVAPAFRYRRLMIGSFIATVTAAVLFTWLLPPKYQAQVKILVKRERVDPIVGPDPNTQLATTSDLTEQDINSEVELMKSRDLLEKVVAAAGLDTATPTSTLGPLRNLFQRQPVGHISTKQWQLLRAAQELEETLSVEPIKKTKLIAVSYESSDPQLAAKVLQTLVRLYFEKHVAVHRVPGALDFFQNQTEEYRRGLVKAEEEVAGFGKTSGVVAAPMEKEFTIRKLSDFEATVQQTRAKIAETRQRIAALEQQARSTPSRATTQVKNSDNAYLLEQLKTTLLNLELKRTELLHVFSPDYRLVKDVEAQIAQARETLSREESRPVHEEATDRDRTYEWLKEQLAQARTELKGLRAQEAAASHTVELYRKQARQLNQTEIIQQDLIRSAKLAEDNFLLYSRKQEEARIRDALDQQRIVNVSVAEEATVPALPASRHRALNFLLGVLLACLVSVGLVYTADYLDCTFRTPQEVELFLDTHVLASLPKD